MIYLFILKEDFEDTKNSFKFTKGDGLVMSSSQKESSVVTCEHEKIQFYVPLSKGSIYKETEIFKCHHCDKYITSEYVKITLGKHEEGKENIKDGELILHKACFNCENCNKSLLNKKATVKHGKIYCDSCAKPSVDEMKRDIKKNIDKIGKLSLTKDIKENEHSAKNGEDEHENLDPELPPSLPIETVEKVERDDDDSDNDNIHCGGCAESIDENAASGYIRAMNKNWHSDCFKCFRCKKTFKDATFYNYEGNPCCLEDYKKIIVEKLPKCNGCKKPISGNCISFNENKFHTNCFVCHVDGQPIERDGAGFYNKDSKIYCSQHYKEKFLDKCAVCKKFIDSAFIEVGGSKYHKNCFKCEECEEDLVSIGLSAVSKKLKKLICIKCAKKKDQ